jgi:hypothetical protein
MRDPPRSGRQTARELAWRDDVDVVVATDDEKILVAGHDHGCSVGDGVASTLSSLGIPGHPRTERRQLDDPHAQMQLIQERHAGGAAA